MVKPKVRIPPHNLEAEQSVLGAMITTVSAIPVVLDVLEAGDFYRDKHRDIFHAIVRLWNGDATSVDQVTVAAQFDEAADKDLIHLLAEFVPAATNARHYADIVKHLSVCRKMIVAGNNIAELGYDDGTDVVTLVDQCEHEVFAIRPTGDKDTKHAKEIAHIILQEVDSGAQPKKTSTGFDQLDSVCGGLHGSNLIIIGARPGVGKTAVGLSVAYNVSQQGTVLFCSLEMSQKELMERLICSQAGVPVVALRNRDITPDQLANIVGIMDGIEKCDLRIIDNPSITMMTLKSKARQYAAKTSLKLIVVDYLQLLSHGTRKESRLDEVTAISKDLKLLARELDVPVIALCQLNRNSTYKDKDGNTQEPDISHLRESGSLEQDADQVWLLSWPKNKEFGSWDQIDIKVAKNRHGSTGTVSLPWNKSTQRIEQ